LSAVSIAVEYVAPEFATPNAETLADPERLWCEASTRRR
jgi:hypothetical protein